MNLVSYKEAIKQGLPKYFTGKPCKHGHIVERRVSGRCCILCASKVAVAWAKVNPEKAKAIRAKWNASNKERETERVKKWRKNNPDTHKRMVKEWREKNAVSYKSYMNQCAIERKHALGKRTPSWLNEGHRMELRSIYHYCQSLRSIGLKYEVDHIVPLRGKNVSGIHVPWNLLVIPTIENRSKGNR